ncbi:hypothetical protein PRZ48_010468 [Zasmidium cellare]|uniref:AB hydrolase-1 domain-containing protein n=1 Tax=Zasmidium cellare TaxID=395010 RepID=A0ABR0E8Q4_ZASCE|nr:hypothetical protein PRZ48_010468 [Zasmidium cellare]
MSNNNKPTIVVGCGAHHIPYHYRFLEDALRNAGYVVRVVQLPSTSAEVVDDAMSKDVQAIREAVEREIKDGNDVVMVLHSWSGFVGSAALEGLEEKVKHIVFLASWIQPSGKGSCEWLGVEELPIDNVENGLNYVSDPIPKFYRDLPPDLAQDSVKHLLPMVNSVTKMPLRIPPVWEKVSWTLARIVRKAAGEEVGGIEGVRVDEKKLF